MLVRFIQQPLTSREQQELNKRVTQCENLVPTDANTHLLDTTNRLAGHTSHAVGTGEVCH